MGKNALFEVAAHLFLGVLGRLEEPLRPAKLIFQEPLSVSYVGLKMSDSLPELDHLPLKLPLQLHL